MGMKHTGKSTLGRLLAERLGWAFFDTDTVIAELSGKTPRQLYDDGGAELMMVSETAACRHIIGLSSHSGSIIATGGGLADNREALNLLKENGFCVYLDTPFDILFERVMESAAKDGRLPPFLQGPDPRALFQELFTRRSATYATMADIHISTGKRTPPEIAQEITDTIQNEQRTNLHS